MEPVVEGYYSYVAGLLPPEVLTENPDEWVPPSSDQVRILVGRASETGISGSKAARLIGVSDASFRKYTASVRANRRHHISFAAWHLLLIRLGIKPPTVDVPKPKAKANQ